eukprot:2418655-Pyramimonas_sp.AAC.1
MVMLSMFDDYDDANDDGYFQRQVADAMAQTAVLSAAWCVQCQTRTTPLNPPFPHDEISIPPCSTQSCAKLGASAWE